MIRSTGIVKRCGFLLVVITLCNGICVAYPSSTHTTFSQKVHPSLTRVELEEIYQYSLDRGVKNASLLALFLLRESKRFLERRETDKAVEYAEYAQKLAPGYPPVYTHLGNVYWAHSRLSVMSVIIGWIRLFKATLNSYSFAIFMLANSVLFFLLSFLLTSAVFSCISIGRYFKLFLHDLFHLFPRTLPLVFLTLCGMLIMVLPLFFHLSIFIVFFYWLILLFIYHSKREQQIIIILAFFLLLSPFMVQFIARTLVTSSSGVWYHLYQVNEEMGEDETEQRLDEWVARNPDDVDVLFSLALLKKREGAYEEARKYYEKVIAIAPSHYRAWCNLGNVLVATQHADAAIEHYTRCLELNPTSVEGYYNLSRTYLVQYMFNESTKNFSKAKEIDPERVDYYSQIYSPHVNRMVIDETISAGEFWEATFKPSEEKQLCSAYLWDTFFKGIPFGYRYGVVLLLLLCVCLLFISHHELGLSVGCEYCGAAVCRRCRKTVYEDTLCRLCVAIFKGRGDYSISTKEKEKKVFRIERFQKRHLSVGKILSLLLPGAGHLWAGYPLRGTAVLFLFFFLLLKLIYWDGFLMNPWLMSNARSYGGTTVVCCIVILLYLYSLLNFIGSSRGVSQFLSLIRVTRKELQVKK